MVPDHYSLINEGYSKDREVVEGWETSDLFSPTPAASSETLRSEEKAIAIPVSSLILAQRFFLPGARGAQHRALVYPITGDVCSTSFHRGFIQVLHPVVSSSFWKGYWSRSSNHVL